MGGALGGAFAAGAQLIFPGLAPVQHADHGRKESIVTEKKRCWHTWILDHWKQWREQNPDKPCPHGQVALRATAICEPHQKPAECLVCGHTWDSPDDYYKETRK